MQHFHCPGKNKIHMHLKSIKCMLNALIFDDSAYKLNALIFTSKTGLAQYKD